MDERNMDEVPEDDASPRWNRAPAGGRGKWFSSGDANQLGIKCRPLLLEREPSVFSSYAAQAPTPIPLRSGPPSPAERLRVGMRCCRPEGSTFPFCLGIALPLACLEVRYMDGRAASRPLLTLGLTICFVGYGYVLPSLWSFRYVWGRRGALSIRGVCLPTGSWRAHSLARGNKAGPLDQLSGDHPPPPLGSLPPFFRRGAH